jgi:hypothetical protein
MDGGTTVEATPDATESLATAAPEPTVEPTIAATFEAPTAQATPTAEPSETATTTAPATLEEFTDGLQSAIAARDFEALQAYMSDPFSVGYWLSEGVSYSPAQAAELLEASLLPEEAQIIWADPEMDLAPLLQQQSPAAFLGPDKEVAAALLSYGWGTDSAGEAIMLITQQPDDTYRWDMMLYSGFGFLGLPTDVEAVLINSDEATFYAGPGEAYGPVATAFGGQNYPVIGVSQDGQWWRLRCYDDNNALMPQCWVSADPAVASPTTLP